MTVCAEFVDNESFVISNESSSEKSFLLSWKRVSHDFVGVEMIVR